jgi:hypothetical protein
VAKYDGRLRDSVPKRRVVIQCCREETAMFCAECGKPYPEAAKFCRSCGAPTAGATRDTQSASPPSGSSRANLHWTVLRNRSEYRSLTELQKFDVWFGVCYTVLSLAALLLCALACVLEVTGVIAADEDIGRIFLGWTAVYGLFQTGFWLYVLPTKLAVRRSRSNRMAIFALDFLLGWTLVGWAVSLSWALASKEPTG